MVYTLWAKSGAGLNKDGNAAVALLLEKVPVILQYTK